MKRKNKKRFVRYARLNWDEDIAVDVADVIRDLGCEIYESPLEDESGVFISNFPLTEVWLSKNHERFNLRLLSWKPLPNEKLPLAIY